MTEPISAPPAKRKKLPFSVDQLLAVHKPLRTSKSACASCTQAAQIVSTIFDGIAAFVFDGGNFGCKQRELCCQLLRKHGGAVIADFDTAKITHLISGVSSHESARLCLKLKDDQIIPDHIVLLKFNWVFDSSHAGSLLDIAPYKVTLCSTVSSSVSASIVPASSVTVVTVDGNVLPSEATASASATSPSASKYVPGLSRNVTWALDVGRQQRPGLLLNKGLIAEFEALAQIMDDLDDEFRARSYKSAVTALRGCTVEITSGAVAKQHLHGIGGSIASKIDEFASNGFIHKRKALENDPRVKATRELMSIHGVGKSTASKWYMTGIRCVADVRKRVGDGMLALTRPQRVGLEHWEDLQKRIPRIEVDAIWCEVKRYALKIRPRLRVECCGSFRRLKDTCGDIDILIMDNDTSRPHTGLLAKIVEALRKSSLQLETLNDDDQWVVVKDPAECETFMGLCRLSPEHPVRRIDIKVYPADQFAAAQLYFTGSEYFNRAVRFYAKKNGYHLGDKGLFRCDRNHLDEPLNLVKVPCETEAAIFKALGLEYVNPEQRDA